jgi:hypothetical protein
VRGRNASTLLGAPVFMRGIRLGEVEDVIVDRVEPRIVGLDVLCGDGTNRFLPYSTARVEGAAVELESALTLIDRTELEFYRAHGRSLVAAPELAGAVVDGDGTLVVPLTARC